MAAKKRPPEPTLGLFSAERAPDSGVAREAPTLSPPQAEDDLPTDTPVVAERTLRIVPPVVEEDVSVERAPDGRYLVSLVKDNGGTRAHVYYTRAQLEKLMRRIPAALEVG